VVTLLKPEQTTVVTQTKSIPIQVHKFLGKGRQGEVYAATMGNERVAVKWYRPEWLNLDPTLGDRLNETRIRMAPSERFLWPADIVTSLDVPGFGYVMPFREARFREFGELMCEQLQASFRPLTTAGLQAAESYQRLHLQGLCYGDISPGNVALDPDTGEIRISDCDNVDVNGRGWRSATSGTEGFMAPEIIQNIAQPTCWSDLWSLAALLFWVFVKNHPLQGRREYEHDVLTKELELRLWGRDALFIFDDADDSNQPVEGYNVGALLYWPIYPPFLRELFVTAFTRGIRNPQQRVLETQWRSAMARLRDLIMPCPACGQESFHDSAAPRQHCWNCSEELPERRRISLSAATIVSAEGACLHAHHLDPRRSPDSAGPLARVVRNARDSGLLELQNETEERWLVTPPHGKTATLGPGDRVGLEAGMRISFGNVEAAVL
jgi:DNA-binding helix-hairpin-helix protein with protein kinase domain